MRRLFFAFILAAGAVRAESPSAIAEGLSSDWGVDGCLTCHVASEDEFLDYVRLVRDSGVRWVRERNVWGGGGDETVVRRMRIMKSAGLKIVAFAGGPPSLRPEQPGNQLPEDLGAVYAEAFRQGRDCAEFVDVWEITGEPDVGYCRDLPDRLAAYNKAMYLGLHAGAASAGKPVIVLMGALALPPGPWLQRAVRNGLLDYTDAYNFHFYGHAADFTGVIDAHRAMVKAVFPPSGIAARHGRPGGGPPPCPPGPVLPLWITECGINATAPGDFLNPERRSLQAAFTMETARRARSARDVAVFMPFILVHKDDPHAMTLSADRPLPAWQAYADETRKRRWPERPLVRARGADAPNPVVLQWMPDNATTVPHKVSGTYRFTGDAPIAGTLRVYNFGDKPVCGRIAGGTEGRRDGLSEDGGRRTVAGGTCTVPAGGRVDVPVTFHPATTDYFREDWSGAFTDETGRRSSVSFGLERDPQGVVFVATPLALKPVKQGRVRFPICEDSQPGETAGPWTTLNGLRVNLTEDGGAAFWVGQVTGDPMRPPQAAAAVEGLPPQGFLRLQLDRVMSREAAVRVDLTDDAGHRFTIWENMGMSYRRPSPDIWLNMADFSPYFWGRAGEGMRLRPSQVREIQLRFYFQTPDLPVEVRLSFMRAKS